MLPTVVRTDRSYGSTAHSVMDKPTPIDYWLDYLIHKTDSEMWEATFEQWLADWQLNLCWRLLREGRQWADTTEQQAIVRYWEGRLAAQQGDLERAVACYKLALDKLPPDHSTTLALYGDLGMIYRLIGNVQLALDMHQQQRQRAEEHNNSWLLAAALDQIGLDYEMRGDFNRAEHYFKQALDYYVIVQDDSIIAGVLNHLGLAQWQQGKIDDAKGNLDAALNIFEREGQWYDIAQVEGNLGNIAYLRGNIDNAERHYLNALHIFNELGVVFDKISLLLNLGAIAEAREAYAEASNFYNEALTLAIDLGNLQGQRDALLNLAVISSRLRQWQEVPDYYRQALMLASDLRDRRSVWDIQRRRINFYLLYTILQIFGWLRKNLRKR